MRNNYIKGAPDPNLDGYGHGGGYGYSYGGGYRGGYGGDYGEGGVRSQRTFFDYLMIFRERIWYLIVAFFIIFLGSILYTVNKTKVYTAASQVQLFRDDSSALGPTIEMEHNQIQSAEDLNTQISLLESSTIIKGVNQRLQGELGERFMAPYEQGLTLGGPLTPLEVLGRNRKIIPRRMSLMIQIAYSHPDPIIAAEVANLFAKEYIDYNLKLNIDASMKAVEDLRIRAEQQKDRVEEIELKIAEYREKNNAVSLDSQENIAGAQLAALNEIKLANKNAYDQLETTWNLVDSYRAQGRDLWELSFIAEQPRVSGLLETISSTRITISSMRKRYRAKHPQMIQQTQILQEAEVELKSAVQNAVEKLYGSYMEAKSNFEMASQRLAEKEKELIDLSKTRVEYNSLSREFEVQQSFFQALNQRMTTEKAQVNLKNPNARIIDEAVPPPEDQPSSPNVVLNLAAGFFGGIAVGMGLIVVVAFLDDRIKSSFDIEGTVGLPLIGIIPRMKRLDSHERAQAVASNVNRHVTEIFRSIHSALKLNDESKNAKVIVATSTVPGEGKSFISSNLALTFANHGEKTLLLDGDLRLPNVARSLNLKDDSGLLNHINDGRDLDEIIQKEIYPNMDVLTSGGKSANPTQVLNSRGFESMLLNLRDQYDRIIIDSPPLAAVSDALNLVSLADGVVYVVKFNTVKKKTAVFNVRRLTESKTPIFGAVLNSISNSVSSYYYASYSDKAYSDYYIDHEDVLPEVEDEVEEKVKVGT